MIGDHYEMIGCDTPYLDDNNFNGEIKILIGRLMKSTDKLTPKDARKIFN